MCDDFITCDTPCPDDPDEECLPPCDEDAWCNQPYEGDGGGFGDLDGCDDSVTCETPCPDDLNQPCYPPCDESAWCNQQDDSGEYCDDDGDTCWNRASPVKLASLVAIPPAPTPASEPEQAVPAPVSDAVPPAPAPSSDSLTPQTVAGINPVAPPSPIPSLSALTTLATSLVANSTAL